MATVEGTRKEYRSGSFGPFYVSDTLEDDGAGGTVQVQHSALNDNGKTLEDIPILRARLELIRGSIGTGGGGQAQIDALLARANLLLVRVNALLAEQDQAFFSTP